MAHFDTLWGASVSPAKHPGLRRWFWRDSDGDLSLYDQDGLTRLVLVDGVYELRSPITWPRRSWKHLESAKHGAELIALSALPPDKATVKALERANKPMKSPLNRPWPEETSGNFIIIESKVAGDAGPLPPFLQRAS